MAEIASMPWSQLRSELRSAASKVAALLRSWPDADGLPLRRVSWSAAEVGAHLVGLPGRYAAMLDSPTPVPISTRAENQRALATVTERDPKVLADLLETEVDRLAPRLGENGDRHVWFFTVDHTAEGVGGILLTELLVHGLDLARSRSTPWPITRTQAVACTRGILPAVEVAVNPRAAERATGTCHLRIRHGDDWTITVKHGDVTVERTRPRRPDLHVSADPVTFLLNAYGHIGPSRATLTGGIVAWGRRPLLSLRLQHVFSET
jgi:hypothetical protein